MRVPIVLLCAAVLAGCGGDGDKQAAATATPTPTPTPTPSATPTPAPTLSAPTREQRPVVAALKRYAAAVRAGDAEKICGDLLAGTVVSRVEEAGGSCERNLAQPRIEESGPEYQLAVESVEVTGARAVAEITATETDGARSSRQPLVREDGSWKLAAR